MKRHLYVPVLLLVASVSLAAQAPPAGWKMRIDRSTSASDPDAAGAIKFVTMGTGFHATNPQAAVYWNPANKATGTYTLKGTFVLQKPSGHTNYYGLVFGGSELEGPNQSYTYFMVAQDGTWLIKRRDGNATPEIAVWIPVQRDQSGNPVGIVWFEPRRHLERRQAVERQRVGISVVRRG